jgi:hypothetical protein
MVHSVRLRCTKLFICLIYVAHAAHSLLQSSRTPAWLVRSPQQYSCRIQRSIAAGTQRTVRYNHGTGLRMSDTDGQQDADDMPDELAERQALQAADSATTTKSGADDITATAKSGPDDAIDWDNAWASKQTELQDASAAELAAKQARPAFSGRKEIVVTGNEEEGYTYTAIEAGGSRPSDGGFKLADEDSQARKDIMARETQLVDAVAFDKVC